MLPILLLGLMARTAAAQTPGLDADPDTEIARRHFDQGTALYGAGRYAEAITEFEAARKAKPLPAFDYNIARAYDRLEHAREAIENYRRYLVSAPNAADAAEVRERLKTLKQRFIESAPAPSAAPAPSPPPPLETLRQTPPPARHRVVTWFVGGTAVALLAGSLVAGLVAHARYTTLAGECPDGVCHRSLTPNAQGLFDSGHAAGLAADILLGVGGAALAAAVILFFVEGRHPVSAAERHASKLAPSLRGGGLAWELP